MFVSSATNMAFPALIGRVLDRTTQAGAALSDDAGGDKVGDSSLKAFVIRALAIFLAGAIGSCVRTHCLRMAKEKTARRLRKKLFTTLLHQVRWSRKKPIIPKQRETRTYYLMLGRAYTHRKRHSLMILPLAVVVQEK